MTKTEKIAKAKQLKEQLESITGKKVKLVKESTLTPNSFDKIRKFYLSELENSFKYIIKNSVKPTTDFTIKDMQSASQNLVNKLTKFQALLDHLD